jgi:hypothetical protein
VVDQRNEHLPSLPLPFRDVLLDQRYADLHPLAY